MKRNKKQKKQEIGTHSRTYMKKMTGKKTERERKGKMKRMRNEWEKKGENKKEKEGGRKINKKDMMSEGKKKGEKSQKGKPRTWYGGSPATGSYLYPSEFARL